MSRRRKNSKDFAAMSAGATRARPGGRSARVVKDVLAAALAAFAESGYAGLSVEDVAARAGVNKTTVYRRWPRKLDLVSAALFSLRERDAEAPDTGSLRDDLFEVLRARVALMSTPENLAIRLAVLLSRGEPELESIIERLRRERPLIPAIVFGRAVQRRELAPRANTRLLAETLIGTVHHRAFWKRESASDQFLRELIDLVVCGTTLRSAGSVGDSVAGVEPAELRRRRRRPR